MSVTESRRLAFETLLELEKTEKKSSELSAAVLEKYDWLPQRDKAFYLRLCQGVTERRLSLDHIIDRYASVKGGKMKLPVRLILRMGVYQLLYMDSVPASAACDQSVQLAKKKGLGGLAPFVNGVLRGIDRSRDAIRGMFETGDGMEALSLRYSVPEWIIELLDERFGKERSRVFLRSLYEERPVSVHISEKADAEALKQAWEKDGVRVENCPYLPQILYLYDVPGVEHLCGFAEGAFFVQDASSLLAVQAAGIKPGDTVVDVCAAPGGKSLAAAELTGETGRVFSYDLTEEKLARIRENARRFRIGNLIAEQRDARLAPEEDQLEKADVLICDLPCSGLGVMGRKAQIRYRLKQEDIPSLQALQREILNAALPRLKKGGTLLYSTCTLTREENDDNRNWLLSEFPLESVDITERVPAQLRSDSAAEGYMQLLSGFPEGEAPLDGFYYSVFRRI